MKLTLNGLTSSLVGQVGEIIDYLKLANKPSINNIELTGNKTTSDLGLIDNTVNDLLNYYLKSETYSKTEVNTIVSNINQFRVIRLDVKPETGEEKIIYLIPKHGGVSPDIHDEWLWINNSWELIGNTQIDLSEYTKTADVNAALTLKQNATDNSFTTTSKTVVGAVNEVNLNKDNKPTRQKFVVDTSIWTIQPTISGSLDATFKASPIEFYFVTLKDIDKSVTEASAVFTATTVKITETVATFAIGDEISIAYSSIYQNNKKAIITGVSNNGTQTTYTFAASTWTAGTSTTNIIMASSIDLPTNQFKLMYFKDCPASIINQVFTLPSLNTGNSGILKENLPIDFKTIGVNWTLRNGGYNSISFNTNAKKISLKTYLNVNDVYYQYLKLDPFDNNTNYITYSGVGGGYGGTTGFLIGQWRVSALKFIQQNAEQSLQILEKSLINESSLSAYGSNSRSENTYSSLLNMPVASFVGKMWTVDGSSITDNITGITLSLGPTTYYILNGSEIIVEEYNE